MNEPTGPSLKFATFDATSAHPIVAAGAATSKDLPGAVFLVLYDPFGRQAAFLVPSDIAAALGHQLINPPPTFDTNNAAQN